MNSIIKEILQELNGNIEEQNKIFSPNPLNVNEPFVGLKTSFVRKMSSRYFRKIKSLNKEQIFQICIEMLEIASSEKKLTEFYWAFKIIAFDWAYRLRKEYEISDFKIFEFWVKNYISDWGDCDDLCIHAIGEFLLRYSEFLPELRNWARSDNWCIRRAAAVSLILPVRKGKYLADIFEISDILLKDTVDLVRKGYGWMLKEASKLFQSEIFDYLIKNKNGMPRVSLRYAIEKMPRELKKEAMK